jgi:lipoprotein signal peptidase
MSKVSAHTHIITDKIEKIGFYLSVLCAIHCAATPIVLTLMPVFGGSFFKNHSWEIAFVGISLILAVVLLARDYKKHFNKIPLLLLLAGAFVKVSEILFFGEKTEFITGSLTAILIASAYWINWQSKPKCDC